MASVIHPRLGSTEFGVLQELGGWQVQVELIDGEVVVSPPTGPPSSSAQGELHHALRGWQDAVDDAGLVLQDVFVEFSGTAVLAPDIAWWSAARRPQVARGAFQVIPELVVEVLSPSTRENDLGPKRAVYASAGVSELWIADPDERTVLVARSRGLRDETTLDVAATLQSPLLPGFELAVARLFG